MNDKPAREWTINQMGSNDSSDQIYGPPISDSVMVIEKSHYDAPKQKHEQLLSYLEPYEKALAKQLVYATTCTVNAEAKLHVTLDKLALCEAALEKIAKAQGSGDKIVCLATISGCADIAKQALQELRGKK